MINNLGEALQVLFKRVSIQEIIEEDISSADVKRKDFVQLMRAYSNTYSETELENYYDYLTDALIEQDYGTEHRLPENGRMNVFVLLQIYVNKVLAMENDEVVCRYPHLLRWRRITNELDEDMLAACFLASAKQERGTKVRLDWKPVITHNNWELRKITDQRMAENHSHFKGTSPIFQLTWISSMNNLHLSVDSMHIKKIDEDRRNINMSYKSAYQEKPLQEQLLQAACIRYLLFELIDLEMGQQREFGGLGRRFKDSSKESHYDTYQKQKRKKLNEYYEYYKSYKYVCSADRLFDIKEDLVSEIHAIQNTYGERILPDYALAGFLKDGGDSESIFFIFQGERWLLYYSFYAIHNGVVSPVYRELFYAYLVIKNRFRAEIVQSNKDVGFKNFSIYEERKDLFLESPFFKNEMVKKAVEACLFQSKAVIMEARIAPKDHSYDYCKFIRQVDSQIGKGGEYRHRLFYIVHFIKQAEQKKSTIYLRYRHWKERQQYEKQAFTLIEFRERYPNYANRIRGIDAANMEIGCGPEVFAPIFRYLSDHTVVSALGLGSRVPQLGKTYHVGEDFLDLTSGLRAIEEAVRFLDMGCRDRLGHALALGVDVDDWYQGKNCRIVLPQQEYLDNIAWMYRWCTLLNINCNDTILSFLRKEFDYYFQMIYRNAMDQQTLEYINQEAQKCYKGTEWEKYYHNKIYDFTIETYCFAWELRGDAPKLYEEGFFDNRDFIDNPFKSFSYYGMNRSFPKEQNKRYLQENAILYYYYHFNEDVRREGDKPIEKKVGEAYIRCVKEIQCALQRLIAQKGIAIETNPSSNVRIGTFKRYDKHPLIRFYNRDLEEGPDKVHACPQINVSINTDDAGIFNTSLENEYAYMALALEKVKDGSGDSVYKRRNIYEWLNHIRIMGLRQSFVSAEEMKAIMKEAGGEE